MLKLSACCFKRHASVEDDVVLVGLETVVWVHPKRLHMRKQAVHESWYCRHREGGGSVLAARDALPAQKACTRKTKTMGAQCDNAKQYIKKNIAETQKRAADNVCACKPATLKSEQDC